MKAELGAGAGSWMLELCWVLELGAGCWVLELGAGSWSWVLGAGGGCWMLEQLGAGCWNWHRCIFRHHTSWRPALGQVLGHKNALCAPRSRPVASSSRSHGGPDPCPRPERQTWSLEPRRSGGFFPQSCGLCPWREQYLRERPTGCSPSAVGSSLPGLHGPDTSENLSELPTTVLTPALVTGSSVPTLRGDKGHAVINQLSGEICSQNEHQNFLLFILKTFR